MVGASNPGEFGHNQPHNIFNDRRIGGKSKNRAVGESHVVKKSRGVTAPPPPPPPPNGPKKPTNEIPYEYGNQKNKSKGVFNKSKTQSEHLHGPNIPKR